MKQGKTPKYQAVMAHCLCINQDLITPNEICPHCNAWVDAPSHERNAGSRYDASYFEDLENQQSAAA
jgi:hypothetical protein